jgi:hypothetical protein
MVDDSSKKNLLVMCDPSGWQWGLGLEFVNDELNLERDYEILDLSFLGQVSLISLAKILFGGYRVRRKSLEFYRSKKMKLIRIGIINYFRKATIVPEKLLSSNLSLNSIVELSGTIDLDFIAKNKRTKKIVKIENRKRDLTYNVLSEIDLYSYHKVVTINGRFTKSATVKYMCNQNKIKCQLIEGGGKKNSYEVFNEGPHSIEEISNKITDLWRQSNEPSRSQIAREFLNGLIEKNALPGINFRSAMVIGKIPELSEKKVCVFYASSEWECIGVGDAIDPSFFQNQVEAFRGLIQSLDTKSWEIFLRRHPNRPGKNLDDGELIIWQEFYSNKYIRIIEANSDIDSLALGMNAHLIASFGSTILTEFIARGCQNVVTLGPAPWNKFIPERYLPNSEALKEYLISERQLISAEQLYPWAYYQSESGNSFNVITTDPISGVWVIN